jgi:cystathionine beta-synthase
VIDVETTSGNTGFNLAMVGIIKGYNCIAVSSKSSKDKIDMLRSSKVYVCLLMYLQMMSDLITMLLKDYGETKGSIYINQYFNQLDAHCKSTGPVETNKGVITQLWWYR